MTQARTTFYKGDRGSALLAALIFCAVLGIALASYVGVCYGALKTSSRNNSGTCSLELAETGLEEALRALNRSTYDWSDWTLNNSSVPKTATKTLSGFSFGNDSTGSVTITIENYDARSTATDAVLRVTGVTTLGDKSTVTRKLQATAKLAPLFVNAVAATYTAAVDTTPQSTYRGVRFANGGIVDSLDSSAVVPPGEDLLAQQLRLNLASYSAIVSSATRITLTNTQINGYVAAGTETPNGPDSPATLLFTYNESSVSGPTSRASQPIDPTRLSSNPYQPVFDIKEPSATGDPLPPGTVAIGSSNPSAGEMIYRANELQLTSGVITVEGHVVLVVTGDFGVSGTAQIQVGSVAVPDSSLQIIVKGTASTLHISDNGIVNNTGRAKNLAIFYLGNPGASIPDANPTISTNTDFCGVVYAPNCDLDFIVSSNLKFTGSLVAKTVTFSGIPTIHYDLDLRKPTTRFSCLETPFLVQSWQEVVP